jgi:hypothetical protein
MAAIFALLSTIFIGAGLRLLTAKKPFIINLWRQALLCFAQMAIIIYIAWPKYPGQSRLLPIVTIGCMTMVCGINLWQFRGGVVIGATETLLHEALRHAFRDLSLPYEESAQAFRLPTLNNELTVGTAAINGMFALRLKGFGNRRVIRQIAAELNDFFRTAPAQTNKRVGYVLAVFGSALLLFGSWVTYERLSFRAEMRAMREAHQGPLKSSEK